MNGFDFEILSDKDETVPVLEIRLYPKGWHLLSLYMGDRPRDLTDWKNLIWGFDLWYGPIPLAKSIIFANLVVWALLWIFRS